MLQGPMSALDQLFEGAELLRRNPFSPHIQQAIRRLNAEGLLPRTGSDLSSWKQWLGRFPEPLVMADRPALALSICLAVSSGVADLEARKRVRSALSWFPGEIDAAIPELVFRSSHVRRALDRMTGNSQKMRVIREQGWSASFGDDLGHVLEMGSMIRATPVLVVGESGTGKELLAQSLCAAAPGKWTGNEWRPATTESVNLAALPHDVVFSALFGHTKGAFSGATRTRTGLLERCHGEAVFLDEVAELPPHAQVALLRALQEGRVRPLGADEDVAAAPRVISATHRDLPELIASGKFRMDLYHRLSSVILRLPALRERLDDVETLVDAHLREMSPKLKPIVKERFNAFWRDSGENYHWPGNVRELLSVVRRLSLGLQPELMALGQPSRGRIPDELIERSWSLDEVKRWYAGHVNDGVSTRTEAARKLDVDRATLRGLLQKPPGRGPGIDA